MKGRVCLFAAEDIVHPDAEVTGNGILTNTGVVYKKNDLVAAAATDRDGNADFLCYTEAPGVEYDYTAGKIRKKDGYLLERARKPVSGEHGEERKLVDRETADSGKILYKRTFQK